MNTPFDSSPNCQPASHLYLLRKRWIIWLGFGLALLLISSAGLASYLSIQRLRENQSRVDHTYRVLNAIAETVDSIKEAELGRRGYLLTQNPGYLQEIDKNVQRADIAFQSLRQLLQDNFMQEQRVNDLEPLLQKRLSLFRQSLDEYQLNATNTAAQINLTNQSWLLRLEIQRRLMVISQVERELLAQRSEATHRSVDSILWFVGLGSGSSIGLLALVYWMLHREVQQRRLAEESLRHTNEQLESRVQERTATLQSYASELGQAKAELEIRVAKRTAELAQANQRLQTSEAKLSRILNSATAVISSFRVRSDRTLTYEYFSDGCEILYGYTSQEFLENPNLWLSRIAPEDREQVIAPLFERILVEEAIEVKYRFFHKNGDLRWIASYLTAKVDAASRLVTAVDTDITRTKMIEAALRQSEAKFRSLSECSPVGIFLTDSRGQLTYTNPRWQEIADATYEEALNDGWKARIHPDDRPILLRQWEETVQHLNESFYREVRYLHKDGSVRYGQVRTAPVFEASGQFLGHVGTVEDITESRAIDQMKNEFISIVSHELRTPLTAIRGSLGLLANGVYDRKPEKGKRMLHIAATQTDRLVRLVNDILDLGRLESGKVTLIKQACDAATLMQQSAEAMQESAQAHQITLQVNPLQVKVWANADAIVQTLTNLISNAIKFSEPGGSIHLNAEYASPAAVRFSVTDQGRGIPPDQLETIFGKFQQVDASDARQKGGTGLGLAICRSIIQQHEGRIWAESHLGAGSTFYFTLALSSDALSPDVLSPDDKA